MLCRTNPNRQTDKQTDILRLRLRCISGISMKGARPPYNIQKYAGLIRIYRVIKKVSSRLLQNLPFLSVVSYQNKSKQKRTRARRVCKKKQNVRQNGRTILTYQVRNVLTAFFMVNKTDRQTDNDNVQSLPAYYFLTHQSIMRRRETKTGTKDSRLERS